jgi:uncharacterized membrane protein YfcA
MSFRISISLAALALAITGCSDGTTRPDAGRLDSDTTQAPGPPPPPDTTGITQRRLIECPTTEPKASSSLIGILGGTVAAAGTSISLPAGALLASTLINVTVPASTYMEVDITANSLPVFAFLKTVTVTIDYSRCPTSVTTGKTLTVWQINPQTKALITNMGGVNDPVQRRMTFTTGHLSGYAIAQ